MEANRYYTTGIRDALKVVPEAKTIEEAEKKIGEIVNQQVANFLSRPAEPITEQKK